ncbi:histone acetyltransferase [Nephila pilipes]|uniref:Histone acetyltransferase n=1 Tax=Nephila pilipes TaxID=299642 RepID=A0A8X6NH67_NEPPI|nr:histone acetyltransferase [Nephila pilipes]
MHQQSTESSYNQHPASAALSSMVNNNSVGTLLLGQGPNIPPANNYLNTVNIGMSSITPVSNPVGGSYMVGVPITSVIQPQSSSVSHQQPTNQASHGSMQRLSHISMPITTSSCAVSTHTFHLQSPSYSYTNATPNQSTSCSLAKLQQLTNGIVEITPNQIASYPSMTPPPSYNSPTHQSNLTPPPQIQRPIAPVLPNIQPQPSSLSSNQVHGYANYRYHPRAVPRTSNIAISSNIVASYPALNSVGYRMQQASPLGGSATLLNSPGYITNAGFINPPSSAMPMGVVNMHPQDGVNGTVCPIRTICDKPPAHMVQMRGLECETKESDIVQFFKPLGITPKAVHLKCDGSGRVSGICEVEFATHAEAVVAMRKKNAFIGNRFVRLTLKSSEIENENKLDNLSVNQQVPSEEITNDLNITANIQASYPKSYSVKMRNAPKRLTDLIIFEFFWPVGVSPVSIKPYYNESGLRTGEFDVHFLSHKDAVRAMSKNNTCLRNKFVELTLQR